MNGLLHRLRSKAEWAVIAWLLVFSLRVLVPDGMMLASDANGRLQMQMCSGTTVLFDGASIADRLLGAAGADDAGKLAFQHDGTLCAYAIAGVAVTGHAATFQGDAPVTPPDLTREFHSYHPVLDLNHAPRGPPLLG